MSEDRTLLISAGLMAFSIAVCAVAYHAQWRWRWWVYALAYLPGFAGVHQVSGASYFQPPGVDTETVGVFWLTSGLLMGTLLVAPWRLWPAYYAMSAAVTTVSDLALSSDALFPSDMPLSRQALASAGWTGAMLLEATIGAGGLRLVLKRVPDLFRPRDLVLFLVICVLGATSVGATLGGGVFVDVYPNAQYFKVWQVWWFSDLLGVLSFAPVMVAWYQLRHETTVTLTSKRGVEALALAACYAFVCLVCVGPLSLPIETVIESPYLVAPVLVWAALRFNTLVSSVLTIAAASFAVFTAKGSVAGWLGLSGAARGPFYVPPPEGTPADTVLPLQAFLLVTLLSIPLVVALYRQRQRVEQQAVDYRDQLFRAQRMESLAQLASGVAHDLNNLLAVIGAYRDQVEQRVGDDDDLAPALSAMDSATDHAATLARSLLDLSRHAPGQPGPIDPNALLTYAADICKPLLPGTIHLDLRPDPDLRRTIRGDRHQLHQVLLNLILNARDAMQPGGGTLTVRARQIGEPATEVELAVQDTGTGIAPQDLPHIFEPLFTTKPADHGTGLGLSIVRGIVEEHGGRVAVQTQPGRGTTFTVRLPLSQLASNTPTDSTINTGVFVAPDHPARDPQTPPPPPTRGSSPVLMLVGDAQVRGALTTELCQLGWQPVRYPTLPAWLAAAGQRSGTDAVGLIDTRAIDDPDGLSNQPLPIPTLVICDPASAPGITAPHAVAFPMPFKIAQLTAALDRLRLK
ncbi:MAG: ATP-binding protein [Phycisphaeraceae bacterium]